MKNIFIYSFFILISVSTSIVKAQQTGSFNEEITFMNAQRTISCFVPSNYDDQVPAKLIIGLHGAGDNSSAYRNALVNALGFESTFENTILLCPDGGDDPSRDFYEPAGDEEIINEAIAFARQNYNIDTNQIILQGFSLGGRSALRYGLENNAAFKALLLNTPAIQGVKEASTDFMDGGLYDFENAGNLPIYITHGSLDELYTSPIDSIYENLVRNNAFVKFFNFPNLNHNIPEFSDQPDLVAFFDSPALDIDFDLNLVRLEIPKRTCEPYLSAKILIQNNGEGKIDSVRLKFEWNGQDITKTYGNLNLNSFEHTEIEFSEMNNLPSGVHELTVSVIEINDGQTDGNIDNNEILKSFKVELEAKPLPFLENFDSEDYLNDWVENFSGDYILPLEYDEEERTLYSLNSIFIFENSGTKEEILSPVLDLNSIDNPHMSFKYAFNYVEYTANVLGVDAVFSDTLEVAISTDCGQNFETIYKKSERELQTFSDPILNPLGLEALLITPGEEDWKTEKIDLANFAQEESVVIKLSYISGLGGFFELENVHFGDEHVKVEHIQKSVLNFYPNPVSDILYIENSDELLLEEIQIMNIKGRIIYQQKIGRDEQLVKINTEEFIPGTYFLSIETGKGEKIVEKISVTK